MAEDSCHGYPVSNMVTFDVHYECLHIRHRAYICSKASIFWFITAIVTLITPLIITYRTYGLWAQEIRQQEQPDVQYLQELLLVLHTSAGPVYWASNPIVRSLAPDNVRQPFIKWHEMDGDHDGLLDGLRLSAELSLLPHQTVQHVTLILAFRYTLRRMCEISVGGGAVVEHSSAAGLASLTVLADLTLHQRHPLLCRMRRHHHPPHILQPHLLQTDQHSQHQDDPALWTTENIMRQYWRQNVTTRLDNMYTSSEPGPSSTFTLEAEVRYVEQSPVYVPGFWYVIKLAWMQYLSVLVVFLYVSRMVKQWLYSNQLLHTLPYTSAAQTNVLHLKK